MGSLISPVGQDWVARRSAERADQYKREAEARDWSRKRRDEKTARLERCKEILTAARGMSDQQFASYKHWHELRMDADAVGDEELWAIVDRLMDTGASRLGMSSMRKRACGSGSS